jgi:DNA-binding FadR family transcriptional regulator
VLLGRQRRTVDALDEETFLELDEEVHLALAAAADRPTVIKYLRQLRGFVRVMRQGARRDLSYFERVQVEYAALVEAIEARNRDQALRTLREHLDRSDYALAGQP